MDTLKMLVETHINARKLEKEIKKCRANLITEYKNKNSSNSNWYILKISYSGFAEQLKKETAKFDKLLQDLNETDIDDSNYSEIIDNVYSDSDSSTGSDKALELDAMYKNSGDQQKKEITQKEAVIAVNTNSVPTTESLYVDQTQIKMECEEKKEIPEKKAIKIINADKVKKINSKSNKNGKSNAEYPVLAKGKVNKSKSVNNGKNKKVNYVKGRTCKVRSGYKYQGKGFEVFTGYRNKSEPIYSSTMLFCRETCNENKKELTNFLIENGKFKKDMIQEIIFKTSYYNRYALIKVKAPLKIIKKKIKTLNKYDGYNTINIFKRTEYISENDMVNANNVLYVNNFDILNGNCHKKFTNLFLKFGELVQDIRMGLDKNRDPYAIVHFRDLQDAQKCFAAKDLSFGGKVLSIRFSKF